MATNKKPRKAYKPKRVIGNLLAFMAKIPEDVVREDAICYELALGAMLKGVATVADCNMLSNALNAAAVLCLQHNWPAHYDVAVMGQRAHQTMITRVRAGKSMLYTGVEMQAVKDALTLYELQMPLMTPRDVANASKLVNQQLVKRNFTKSINES